MAFPYLFKFNLVLFLLFIFIQCNSGTTKSSSDTETIKYKCREHIEEALKHYWDVDEGKEKHITNDANTESVDEDDDFDDDDKDDSDAINKSIAEASCDEDEKDEESDSDVDEKSLENVTETDEEEEEVNEEENKTADESETEEQEDNDTKETAENKSDEKASVEEEKAKESEETEESLETVENKATSNESDQNESDENENVDTKTAEDSESVEETTVEEKVSNPAETKKEIIDENDTKESTEENVDSNETNETEEEEEHEPMKSRSYVEDILKLYEIGTKEDTSEQNLIQSLFKDMKKIYETAIKPLEQIFKYRALTSRLITDAEIFAKPMVLFLGAKGSGKTSLVNYILGIQSTPWQLKTEVTTHSPQFTVINHGDTFTKLSPTEISADFTLSSLQQFGQHFVQHHMQAYRMPMTILQKMTIVDSPGLIDGLQVKPETTEKSIDGEVYQWFIDRSDIIYIVIDVTQLHMTTQLHSLIDQLKGRDVRFLITKADTVKHSQLIMLIGQLLWILSPVMTSEEPPKVYAITTSPLADYDPFLDDQEQQWLTDLSEEINGIERVESRVSLVRRHALRVRNHAKIIDCYINTYYRNKGIFTFGESARKLAKEIIEKPNEYRVFSGSLANQSQNISRYDLPDPELYRDFFLANPLTDFKPLSSTCSFFKGCPLDKLDVAIAYQLPEIIGKYKKLTKTKK